MKDNETSGSENNLNDLEENKIIVLSHPEIPDQTCICPNNDYEKCINGIVYGMCSSEYCEGVCTNIGRCPCPCH